jgi:hypothetical protein
MKKCVLGVLVMPRRESMRQLPLVQEKLEGQSLSLTSASKLQRFFRSEKKHQKKSYSPEQKLELLRKCEGRSKRELDLLLATHSPEWAKEKREHERVVSPDRMELRFNMSLEGMKLLDRVRELRGAESLEAIFHSALKLYVEQLEKKAGKRPSKRVARPVTFDTSESESQVASEPECRTPPEDHCRYVRIDVRATTLDRAEDQCEFVDQLSQRRCTSRYKPQFDHIVPFAMGGPSTAENVRLLCPAHNQLHAIQCYGESKMREFAE